MIHIPDFETAKTLVIGDVMLDRQWSGSTARISPEAPVPVVKINKRDDRPGGAGNVALNMRTLGSKVTLLGVIGQDDNGDTLLQTLTRAEISTSFIRTPDQPTITKCRITSQHQQLIRLDFEGDFTDNFHEELLANYHAALDNIDVVILSDYGKGTLKNAQPFIEAARAQQIPVLVDPKGKDFKRYHGASLLTPNLKEFEMVVGPCPDNSTLEQKALGAIKAHDLQALLITRGADGMSLIQAGKDPLHLPTKARDVFDVTGAGDTVISTIAASLGAGCELAEAVTLSNYAAGIAVTKLGTATISVPELARTIKARGNSSVGIVNQAQLKLVRAQAKLAGEKVVFTNGCFDILHAGHVAYLQEARALGHRLIVAVNDDASVSRLKGNARPFNTLKGRMAVLASLGAVDWVVPFSEDTPAQLIALVQPDVLVKGGDYKVEEIAGHDTVLNSGGDVKILQFVDGLSTSNLVQTIREKESI